LQKPDKFLHLPQIFAIERAESRWTDRLFIHLTLSGGSDASSDEDRNGRRRIVPAPVSDINPANGNAQEPPQAPQRQGSLRKGL
jgi:hypothetical protein